MRITACRQSFGPRSELRIPGQCPTYRDKSKGQSDSSGLDVYSGRPHSQDGFPEFVYVSELVFSPVIFRTKAS
jgi:hypothetical protein